jgi:hypothetical protein
MVHNITVHRYCNCTAAKKRKNKKTNFKKKWMDCFMFMGTAFKRLKIGVLLDVKGIFTAQSYPTQYVLFNIWVT